MRRLFALLAAAALATGADAQGLLGIFGGGAPVTYAPSAVSFTPATALRTAGALGITDSPSGLSSFWIRTNYINTAQATRGRGDYSGDQVPFWNNLRAASSSLGEGSSGVGFIVDNANPGTGAAWGTIRTSTGDATGSTAHQYNPKIFGGLAAQAGQWVHVIYAWSTNFADGSKRSAIYFNGVNQSIPMNDGDGSASFSVNLSTANGFGLNYWGATSPYATTQGAYDVSQLAIWTGTNYVNSDGTINAATVAKLYSGGPVDFDTTTGNGDGLKPFGVAPSLYYNGDASAFATNKGSATGGNLSLASGNILPLANNSWGPAGLSSGRIGLRFRYNGSPSASQTGLSRTVSTGGVPVKIGDYLVVVVAITDSSGSAANAALYSVTSSGWTVALHTSGDVGAATWGTYLAVLTKFADSTDVAMGNDPTWTFTTAASGAAIRWFDWTMLGYQGVDTTTPIPASGAAASNVAASATPSRPSATTDKANSLVLSMMTKWISPVGDVGRPVGTELRYVKVSGGNSPGTVIADEVQATVGSTTARSFLTTDNHQSSVATLVLRPQ